MANTIYPKYKEAILQGSSNSALTGTVKAMLIDLADYTYDSADEFLSDIAGASIVATSAAIGSKTYTDGVFGGANVVFTAVTGDVSEALIYFIDTGVAGTSRVIAFIDTGVTGFPVTPNGGDINLNFNVSGLFQL